MFIAEVYNPGEYRHYIASGFNYLYDKVGLYDTLRAIICDGRSASSITGCWQSIDDIRDHMLNFLENHDEQRIASAYFAGNAHKALPALVVSSMMGTNPFMVYAGQEIGETGMDAEGFSGSDGRTSIFDYWSVPSLRKLTSSTPANELTTDEATLYNYYYKVLNLCKNNLPSPMALFTICNTPTIAINMGTIATGNTLLSANLTMGKHCLSLQTLTLTQYTLECAFHHMPFPSCASDVDLPLPPT